MTSHLEVEAKLEAPGEGIDLPALDGLPGVVSVGVPQNHELEASYVDTADLALARAHVTLRRRTGGDDAGWHAKLPTADGRWEVHAPLGDPDAVPQQLLLVLRGVTRDAPLAPVALLRTRRTVVRLLGEDEAVLAEVVDDRVTAQSPPGDPPRAWREWEVELVAGDRGLLDAVVARLLAGGARPARTESKLQRALGGRAPRATPEPPDDGSAVALAGARLRRLVGLLRTYDPLARADAPDAIHQMRVTVRRLRGALATFRPLLDRSVTEPLREELRWVAEALGFARDAEVLHSRLLAQLDELAPEQVRGGLRDFVAHDLATAHRRAHERAVESLSTARYFGLLDRLTALAEHPPWRPDAAGKDLDVLRRRVAHELARVERAVDALEPSPDDPDWARLHAVRKAAKRARYAAEPLLAVDGKPAQRFVAAMRDLQTTLGSHQDSVVARRALRPLSDRATAAGENAYALGLLEAATEEHAALRRHEFRKAWSRANRPKVRRWLSG